ncbi:LacI family DNA-binding transcriptional regulator [Litoreibacter sp.]|nr:LacI family DNA-binding transcriptional regulator [Litoreibacter sp.]
MRKPLQSKTTKPNVSIFDVAELAGLSTASVSRVINSPGSTKDATRVAVQEAVKKLGYIPNGAARALSSRNSKVVGAIIPTIDNSIFAQGIQALQSYLMGKGYYLLLGSSNYDPDQEFDLCRNFLVQQVAGIIMMGDTHHPDCVEMLRREDTPFVNTGTYSPDGAHCVGFDNAKAATKATRYLLDLGHKEFAMIAGVTKFNDRAINRVNGVKNELARAGISLAESRILERPYEIEAGGAALKELMKHPSPPTAIICGNDVLASGAVLTAAREGIRIPEEVSIMGFDDLVISRHLSPSLTTIQIPTQVMWCRAADMLLDLLKGKERQPAVEIDVSLIVRESTAPPRQ